MTTTLQKSAAAPAIDYARVAPVTVEGMFGLSQKLSDVSLSANLLGLVKMLASQINGCAFCLDMHARELLAEGETQERLFLLSAWRDAAVFSARGRAALRWTEKLTRLSDGFEADHELRAVREHFSEKEIAELSFAIVVINGWNRMNVPFGVPPGWH